MRTRVIIRCTFLTPVDPVALEDCIFCKVKNADQWYDKNGMIVNENEIKHDTGKN